MTVSVCFLPRIVQIPINRNGSAGEPEILYDFPSFMAKGLFAIDDIALDVFGNIYASVIVAPNVPKASEIREHGLNHTEFQMKLLEKIEELTLYAVQQAKTIELNKREVSDLKSENADLRIRLNAMEQMKERLAKQGK